MTVPSIPVDATAAAAEPSLFRALIAPYRSLSPRGFTILMLLVGIVSTAVGTAFLMMGAWPVFGFFGLDALLLYLAFRRNYADARAFEEIDLTRTRLLVRQVTPSGARREYSFDPYWTKLEIDRSAWGGIRLALASSGRRLAIADFLGPDDRPAFAKALGNALSEVRTTPAT